MAGESGTEGSTVVHTETGKRWDSKRKRRKNEGVGEKGTPRTK